MKLGTSIIIFFMAIVALVAEFILYIFFGVGAAFSGDLTTLSGAAFLFVCLMVLTAATGVLAPICALIELATKKKNIGAYTMVCILSLILVWIIIINSITKNTSTVNKTKLPVLDQTKTVIEEVSRNGLVTNTNKLANHSDEKNKNLPQKDQDEFSYYEKVIIKNIDIGKSILEEIGVFGEVKNIGNRTLNKVEITIYCLDNDGKPIFEKKYHPVLVTESLFGDNEPLKSNYSRKFGVKLDDAPSDWAQKVEIKVTDIGFED